MRCFLFLLSYDKLTIAQIVDIRELQPLVRLKLPFTDRHYPMETFWV